MLYPLACTSWVDFSTPLMATLLEPSIKVFFNHIKYLFTKLKIIYHSNRYQIWGYAGHADRSLCYNVPAGHTWHFLPIIHLSLSIGDGGGHFLPLDCPSHFYCPRKNLSQNHGQGGECTPPVLLHFPPFPLLHVCWQWALLLNALPPPFHLRLDL